MLSLPARSWLSFSEGFLPPENVVDAVLEAGADALVFADSGEIAAVPAVLTRASEKNIPATVGIEFYLLHQNRLRRATAFARGNTGLGDLFKLAGRLYHPQDKHCPKGQLLPGEDLNLPVGTIDMLGKGLILVSGGRGSHFEDCRSRGDVRGFCEMVDAVRAAGCGAAAGYDPEIADARDGIFLGELRKHTRPISVLPWRWGACKTGQEELFHSSARSVFGKSPDPVALRVGASLGSMSDLQSGFFSEEEISSFSKATQIQPGEFQLSKGEKSLRYITKEGKFLSDKEACELLRIKAERSLDALITKAGLKGDRAKARRDFYVNRINKELEAIETSGVGGRILYVADLMEFCRKNRIKAMTRGSAANSLVCYLNRISPLNPVTFNLPSERFINPKRRSVPDIDIDVAASRAEDARSFLTKIGRGGVGLRSSVNAGFVDVLQRELKAAGVPYAHELRERIRTAMGSRRVPNTYKELSEEYSKFVRRGGGDSSFGELDEFIASRLSSVNPEVIQGAIEAAKELEGRPVYHIDHVGVAMTTEEINPHTPFLKGSNGGLVLAAEHDEAESLGFSKIDVLSRRALDVAEAIQVAIEKNGGRPRPVASVFTPNKKPIPELRRGLVGGLDQIGPGGKSQIPHAKLLGAWEEDFTNFDLINYLALVRYGTHGWKKGSRPQGEFRPRMMALYCGSMAASHALEQLGNAVATKAEVDLREGGNYEFWKKMAALSGGSEGESKNGKSEIIKNIRKLPSTLAHMESLGGDDVSGRLLARITWGNEEGDKRSHLVRSEEAVRSARKGNHAPMKEILSSFYKLDPQDPVFEKVCESLSSGKAIQRPEYISKLGARAIGAWDKVTSDTRGLLLFQEQVTELLVELSGCDYATCDVVRDAIAHAGKNIPEQVKKEICDGVQKTTGKGGEDLLREFTEDGPYLFNKGHATVYAGLISWQLEAKRNWPASYSQAFIDNARKVGAKAGEARDMLGAVLGDAQVLGCQIDVSELPERSRTEAVDRPTGMGGSVLKLGMDAFLGVSQPTLLKLEKLEERDRRILKKSMTPEDLSQGTLGLPPEDAEIVFSLLKKGPRALKTFQKNLGFVPEAVRKDIVGDTGDAMVAEDLNMFKPSGARIAEVWGFVLSTPQISAGQGKRPCRLSCEIGTGCGRDPLEISFVFWPERGKETNGFLPKEAVELQARLNSLCQRGVPISTVVRLNDTYGRWYGATTTIRSLGGRETNSEKTDLKDGGLVKHTPEVQPIGKTAGLESGASQSKENSRGEKR
jgi:hypothetical protein